MNIDLERRRFSWLETMAEGGQKGYQNQRSRFKDRACSDNFEANRLLVDICVF